MRAAGACSTSSCADSGAGPRAGEAGDPAGGRDTGLAGIPAASTAGAGAVSPPATGDPPLPATGDPPLPATGDPPLPTAGDLPAAGDPLAASIGTPPPVDGPTPPDAGPGRDPAPQRRGLGCLFEVVETVVLTLVIFFVIQTFVAQPYQVHQSSMERTFEEGQYVLVDKLSPHWSDYHRGDVIVFNPPEDFENNKREPFIKRVIGLPGETVEIRDGSVWIDGNRLVEGYLYDGQATVPEGSTSRWVVGAGQLFVMGDHRQMSSDSRVFGPIAHDSVIGRAFLRYWPLDTIGIMQAPTYPGLADAAP